MSVCGVCVWGSVVKAKAKSLIYNHLDRTSKSLGIAQKAAKSGRKTHKTHSINTLEIVNVREGYEWRCMLQVAKCRPKFFIAIN